MFLSVCGLMSTGTRTVLISRWRTGGQTSYELMRQFVQELPYSTADDAWQRSVQTQIDTPLDLTREPRMKRRPTPAISRRPSIRSSGPATCWSIPAGLRQARKPLRRR